MPSIPSIQPFPGIGNLFDESLNPENEHVDPSTSRFLDEFIWYAEALKSKREKGNDP